MVTKKPNFFILGAPKCGTTSIADWLRGHPRVFMSNPKEPHFFNTDSRHHAVFSLAQYEDIFKLAGPDTIAIGEASVWYLVSEAAVDNILAYQPEARFIVCLRNPIEAAVSLHDQKVFSGDENIFSFRDAWDAQLDRRAGKLALPDTCMDVNQLMYGGACLFGKQCQKLLRKIERDKLLIILMDDILKDPRAVYLNVLRHVGVKDDGKAIFTRSNPSKERKLLWVRKLLRYVTMFKNRFGMISGTGLGRLVNKWNTVERRRDPLDGETRKLLVDYFSNDIDLLESLLERDLQEWKNDQ